MAVLFKYRTPASYTYAPGFVQAGIKGDPGKQGDSGNALYFIDFEADNSYNIEMILQKIEGNYIISTNSIDKIAERPYKVNDLLLSNNGNCYQIIKSSETSIFNNFKFDIKPLGSIKNVSYNNIKHIRLYDVTGLKIYSQRTGRPIKYYDPRQLSCWVNNRTEKPYSTNFIGLKDRYNDDEDFALYGAWVKMCAVTNTQNEEDKDKIKYSFSIGLNGSKEYSLGGSFLNDTDDLSNAMGKSLSFKKNLEFPTISVFQEKDLVDTDTYKGLLNNLLREVVTPGHTRKPVSMYTAYFSDYSTDSLHPFGNNIACTLSQDRSMWYKTGIGSDYPETVEFSENLLSSNPRVEGFKRYSTIDKTIDPFGAGFAFTQEGVEITHDNLCGQGESDTSVYSNTSTPLDIDWFPKYSLGQSLTKIDEKDVQTEIDENKTSNLILYSKYKDYSSKFSDNYLYNSKSGNSLYFSGMKPSNVPLSIFNYLTNPSNEFKCIIKNTESKEINLTNVPIMISSAYRNKSFYVMFEDDPLNNDKNMYNTPEDSLEDDPTPPTPRDDENTSQYKYFWSFTSPKKIVGNTSVDVYFLYNGTLTDANFVFNELNTHPFINARQKDIFFSNEGEYANISYEGPYGLVMIENYSNAIEELSESSKDYINTHISEFMCYKVTITAKNVFYDTYVSIRLRASFKKSVSDELLTEVISEPLVSYSDPNAVKPAPPDLDNNGKPIENPIIDIIEREDDNRESFILRILHVPETKWSGEIIHNGIIETFTDETISLEKELPFNTPYRIIYSIDNIAKYYMLGEKLDNYNENAVEVNGEYYTKTHQAIYSGRLYSDTTIGEALEMYKEVYDVSLHRGNFLAYKQGNTPYNAGKFEYGSLIEDISNETYESLNAMSLGVFDFAGQGESGFVSDTVMITNEEGEEEIITLYNVYLTNKFNNETHILEEFAIDTSTFDYEPEVITPITGETAVTVSGHILDRETYAVNINIHYYDSVEQSTDAYKQYALRSSINFKQLIASGYRLDSSYVTYDEVNYPLGHPALSSAPEGTEFIPQSSISISSGSEYEFIQPPYSEGEELYVFNDTTDVLTINKPTKYKNLTINVTPSWEGIETDDYILVLTYDDVSTGLTIGDRRIIMPRAYSKEIPKLYMDLDSEIYDNIVLRLSIIEGSIVQSSPKEEPVITLYGTFGVETFNIKYDSDNIDLTYMPYDGYNENTRETPSININTHTVSLTSSQESYDPSTGEIGWYSFEITNIGGLEYGQSTFLPIYKIGALSTTFIELEIINTKSLE